MKNLCFFFCVVVCLSSCSKPARELFNGKDLDGWDTYLGPVYDPMQKKFDSLDGPGLNNDPAGVFSVVMEDGEPAIRVSGEGFGGFSTQQEFSNYHLTAQFKWGKKKSAPKDNEKRDSGLLYHAVGPHGADYRFWMRSQEFQIQEGDCGDYWGVAGGIFDVPVVQKGEKIYVYQAGAPLLTFSEKSPVGRHAIKDPDAEHATGVWNTIELYCFGDTAVHVVNGQVNMVLFHSRQLTENGEAPLKQGKLQFQSEGAEIFFRKIAIESIAEIPPMMLR